jgi:hypothetical protein
MNTPIPSLPFYPAQVAVPVKVQAEPVAQVTIKPMRKMHPKMMEQMERMKQGKVRPKKANNMGSGVSGIRPKKSASVEYH